MPSPSTPDLSEQPAEHDYADDLLAEEYDLEDCGMTDAGGCMYAGTEWCDFECPFRGEL